MSERVGCRPQNGFEGCAIPPPVRSPLAHPSHPRLPCASFPSWQLHWSSRPPPTPRHPERRSATGPPALPTRSTSSPWPTPRFQPTARTGISCRSPRTPTVTVTVTATPAGWPRGCAPFPPATWPTAPIATMRKRRSTPARTRSATTRMMTATRPSTRMQATRAAGSPTMTTTATVMPETPSRPAMPPPAPSRSVVTATTTRSASTPAVPRCATTSMTTVTWPSTSTQRTRPRGSWTATGTDRAAGPRPFRLATPHLGIAPPERLQ